MEDHAEQFPKNLLTPKELAFYLSVHLSWVYGQSKKNGFPMVRCGKYLRYDLASVLAYLGKEKDESTISPEFNQCQ